MFDARSSSLIVTLIAILISCNQQPSSTKSVANEQHTSQVAILGMLHFVSKNNTVSQRFSNINNGRRQSELRELIDALKEFNPTKIAVERPYKSMAELNYTYNNFRHGIHTLSNEETDQIAFRLANILRHDSLYLAYAPVDFDFESVVSYAGDKGQSYLIDSIVNNAEKIADRFDNLAEEKSLKDALYYLNTKSAIDQNHNGYLMLTQVGIDDNDIGLKQVGKWYASNLKIYSNIKQLATSKSDRILVIYGQGHCKILSQLIKDSPDLDYVNINDYL